VTREVVSPDRTYSIILPGTWAVIPLQDEAAMTKRIVAMVKKQVGGGDRAARMRRQTRDEFVKTAQQARDAGATSFALSFELMPGVPFPAALLSTVESWPVLASAELSVADRLRAAVPGAVLLEHQSGPVARQAESAQQRVGQEKVPSLRVVYWVPRPHNDDLLRVTISAPMVDSPELFTELFDAIVDSIAWKADSL
jgi:acetyl esterase/lipase